MKSSKKLSCPPVVKNFLYESAAKIIHPLVLTAYSNDFRTIMIRVAPNVNLSGAIQKIGQTLKSFDNDYIMSTRITSDIYKEYYADEDRIEQLTSVGAILSLIIVLMGIFVLVSQNITKRTKEIGIRKVLGGSTAKILILIYSNSVIWTLIAAIIAIPLSYLYLYHWLQDYKEKTPLSWWIFILGVAVVLSMEILITFFHTWRETSKNPVEALRYE